MEIQVRQAGDATTVIVMTPETPQEISDLIGVESLSITNRSDTGKHLWTFCSKDGSRARPVDR